MLNRFVLLFFFSLAALLGHAQQPTQYAFTHFSVNNGVASYQVNAIVQDANGYMWLATLEGLQRFDGTRFLTFKNEKGNPKSISSNHIQQLKVDPQNRLWMVTDDGSIGIFDTRRFTYSKVSSNYPPSSGGGNKFLELDARGRIYFVYAHRHVMVYDSISNRFLHDSKFLKLPAGWKIFNLKEYPSKNKFIIGADSGIVVFNKSTGVANYAGHNPENDPLIEHYGKMQNTIIFKVDSKDRVWFHQWPAHSGTPFFYCYDLKNKRSVLDAMNVAAVAQNYVEPEELFEQRDGTIWLTGNNLFMKFDERNRAFHPVYNGYLNEQGIIYKSVFGLYEDRENNLWVPTSNNGIYHFNPAKQLFSSIKHINRSVNRPGTGSVMSFIELNNGDLLTGTWGDAIYRYDSMMNEKPLNIKGINEKLGYAAWGVTRADNQRVWFGLQPGIFIYNEISGVAKYYNPPLIKNRTIRRLATDKLGNIWIGTQNLGVFKWIKSKGAVNFDKGIERFEKIPNQLIENIQIDRKGYVWVCTMGMGAFKIDPANDSIVEHLSTKGPPGKKLGNDGVAAVLDYNDSITIIVSGGLNIYNTRKNTIRYIGKAEGLTSESVQSIEKDKFGFLWISLLNGICRMNLASGTITYFDRNDGLSNDNFVLASSAVLKDGRIVFGTDEDFVFFDPSTVRSDQRPLDVQITEFRVQNKFLKLDSLQQLSRIELPSTQNSLAITFGNLSYFRGNKSIYYFRMEGLETEWRKADILNQALYSYLPPGEYTFQVKAENGDGLSSRNITSYKILVKPPFWQSPWFIALVVFISIAILYWLDKYRMDRLKESQETRSSIARSLSRDISSTLSNINVLSEMARLKAGSDIDRTREYVGQISDNSQRMMEVMDDMLWSINPQNDEFHHTVERMKKYASRIQREYNMEIGFSCDPGLHHKKLTMHNRHELYLFYKEALLNAGKHSKSKYAEVAIHYEKKRMILQVIDDGTGFDSEAQEYGRGLNELRKRAAALNAKLDIYSRINNGTVITLDMSL